MIGSRSFLSSQERVVGSATLLECCLSQVPQSPRGCGPAEDQYIAPEAYEGTYSPAADIFAVPRCGTPPVRQLPVGWATDVMQLAVCKVGVMMFALMRGRFPFSHKLFDARLLLHERGTYTCTCLRACMPRSIHRWIIVGVLRQRQATSCNKETADSAHKAADFAAVDMKIAWKP